MLSSKKKVVCSNISLIFSDNELTLFFKVIPIYKRKYDFLEYWGPFLDSSYICNFRPRISLLIL